MNYGPTYPSDYLTTDLDPDEFAAFAGAKIATGLPMPAHATYRDDLSSPMPVLIARPERRLGAMRWGIGDTPVRQRRASGLQFEGRGTFVEHHRRRRCAVVLTAYAMNDRSPEVHARRWQGPPTLFAAVYAIDAAGPRFALIVSDARPIALTLETADAWLLRCELKELDDDIADLKAAFGAPR